MDNRNFSKVKEKNGQPPLDFPEPWSDRPKHIKNMSKHVFLVCIIKISCVGTSKKNWSVGPHRAKNICMRTKFNNVCYAGYYILLDVENMIKTLSRFFSSG
jgi:hypothetical protein